MNEINQLKKLTESLSGLTEDSTGSVNMQVTQEGENTIISIGGVSVFSMEVNIDQQEYSVKRFTVLVSKDEIADAILDNMMETGALDDAMGSVYAHGMR